MRPLHARLAAVMRVPRSRPSTACANYNPLRNLISFSEYLKIHQIGPQAARCLARGPLLPPEDEEGEEEDAPPGESEVSISYDLVLRVSAGPASVGGRPPCLLRLLEPGCVIAGGGEEEEEEEDLEDEEGEEEGWQEKEEKEEEKDNEDDG